MIKDANSNVAYYDKHASEYFRSTVHLDMSVIRARFLSYLPKKGLILDGGSGSGRDTLEFLKLGYQVEAFDGSKELAALSTQLTGVPTAVCSFEEFCATDRYDGIWASASLLHVPRNSLPQVLAKLGKALKCGGIMFASFKEGTREYVAPDGRLYLDLTAPLLREMLRDVPGLTLRESWTTEDSNSAGAMTSWLNSITIREC